MPIHKVKHHVDVYRLKATQSQLNELSGRGNPEITRYLNHKIVNELQIVPSDVLVDVGCGDGSLLTHCAKQIRQGIGLVPTQEELERLYSTYASIENIRFDKAMSKSLPFHNDSVDKLVCNGVLLLLPSVKELEESVREFSRVTRNNALLWIGEMPYIDENQYYGTTYGDSLTGWLVFLLKKRGIRAALQGVLRIVRAMFTKESFIISPKQILYVDPQQFIRLAESNQFRCMKYEKTKTKNIAGVEMESSTRYDYLLMKVNNLD